MTSTCGPPAGSDFGPPPCTKRKGCLVRGPSRMRTPLSDATSASPEATLVEVQPIKAVSARAFAHPSRQVAPWGRAA